MGPKKTPFQQYKIILLKRKGEPSLVIGKKESIEHILTRHLSKACITFTLMHFGSANYR